MIDELINSFDAFDENGVFVGHGYMGYVGYWRAVINGIPIITIITDSKEEAKEELRKRGAMTIRDRIDI